MKDLSLPLRLSSLYLLRSNSSSSCNSQTAYLVDVASLVVKVDKRGAARVGNLLLLLYACEIVDGLVGVAELKSSEALPEHIERVVSTLVELSAGILERLPKLLPDQEEDRALADLELHLLVL